MARHRHGRIGSPAGCCLRGQRGDQHWRRDPADRRDVRLGVNVKRPRSGWGHCRSPGKSHELEVDSPPNLTVGWQYGDLPTRRPNAHEVANCSAAQMKATLTMPGHNAVTNLGTCVARSTNWA